MFKLYGKYDTAKVVPNLVGGNTNCFAGDTPVWCTTCYRPIKELAEQEPYGFLTDSFDETYKGFITNRGIAKLTRKNAELVRVNYVQHRFDKPVPLSVRCTPDHKFLTVAYNINGMHSHWDYKHAALAWVEAKDLKPDMQLVANDDYVTITSVEPLAEREDVYCLTVPETHNFTIHGGIIVHNCGMSAI